MRWSSRWNQQHDGVVLMVESIYGQGFAYAREVEEETDKETSQTRQKEATRETARRLVAAEQFSVTWRVCPLPFL
jgi:hypothetical protein